MKSEEAITLVLRCPSLYLKVNEKVKGGCLATGMGGE